MKKESPYSKHPISQREEEEQLRHLFRDEKLSPEWVIAALKHHNDKSLERFWTIPDPVAREKLTELLQDIQTPRDIYPHELLELLEEKLDTATSDRMVETLCDALAVLSDSMIRQEEQRPEKHEPVRSTSMPTPVFMRNMAHEILRQTEVAAGDVAPIIATLNAALDEADAETMPMIDDLLDMFSSIQEFGDFMKQLEHIEQEAMDTNPALVNAFQGLGVALADNCGIKNQYLRYLEDKELTPEKSTSLSR